MRSVDNKINQHWLIIKQVSTKLSLFTTHEIIPHLISCTIRHSYKHTMPMVHLNNIPIYPKCITKVNCSTRNTVLFEKHNISPIMHMVLVLPRMHIQCCLFKVHQTWKSFFFITQNGSERGINFSPELWKLFRVWQTMFDWQFTDSQI